MSEPAINATPAHATTGNAFRLVDPVTGEWHYNLDTLGMSKGTWEVRVTLNSGDVHTAFLGLK